MNDNNLISNKDKIRRCTGLVKNIALCGFFTLVQMGCTESTSVTSNSTTLQLRGHLATSLTSTHSFFSTSPDKHPLLHIKKGTNAAMLIVCTTQDGSSIASQGVVSSEGTFDFPVKNGANNPVSCVLESIDGGVIATLVIESSGKDLTGAVNATSDQFMGGAVVDLGSVTYNPDTQEAVTSTATGLLTSSTSFDPTGGWVISAPNALDPGYSAPCAAGTNSCPVVIGNGIYINRLSGTNISDGGSTFGLQWWQSDSTVAESQATMDSCGDKTGLSTTQASAADVSYKSGGILGAFSFATATSFTLVGGIQSPSSGGVIYYTTPPGSTTATLVGTDWLNSGYQLKTAKSLYQMNNNCTPQSVTVAGTTYNANVCTDGTLYRVDLSGGCTDSSGNAVTPFPSEYSSTTGCSTVTDSPAPGYHITTCRLTHTPIGGVAETLTCTNVFGLFQDSGLTAASAGTFNWASNNKSIGTSCQNMVAGNVSPPADPTLLQAQCYAVWYQANLPSMISSQICVPKMVPNWTSTTAANLVQNSFRSQGLAFMEKLTFQENANGVQTAALRTQQNSIYAAPIPANGGANTSWINCQVREVDVLRLIKLDSTHMKATYATNSYTLDTSKAACVAMYGSIAAVKRYQATLTKQ